MSDVAEDLIITPRKPIMIGEAPFATLVLREPTAFELVQCDPLTGYAYDVALVALVSGWPKAAVEKLGARDLRAAGRFLGTFLS